MGLYSVSMRAELFVMRCTSLDRCVPIVLYENITLAESWLGAAHAERCWVRHTPRVWRALLKSANNARLTYLLYFRDVYLVHITGNLSLLADQEQSWGGKVQPYSPPQLLC